MDYLYVFFNVTLSLIIFSVKPGLHLYVKWITIYTCIRNGIDLMMEVFFNVILKTMHCALKENRNKL